MDPSEAIRILVEKVRPWVNHFPEWNAAIDALASFVEDKAPTSAPVRESVEIVDAAGVRRLPEGAIYAACSSTGVPERSPRVVGDTTGPVPAGWAQYRVLYRPTGWATPKPPAPKVGDPVPDHAAAIGLPLGTMLTGRSGVRGFVTPKGIADEVHVDWASTRTLAYDERWPAKIADLPQ